ncbi:MAG: GFA family protein [Devosia sp.]|nr:GFA family protein [Devosia sp.]
MPADAEPTGGCQCGAVRFRAGRLGAAAICHCRMCQKAFGGFFGPLVSGYDVVWTRGAPSYFQSSNKFRRGFCSACGTPLTYERIERGADQPIELAIGALDDPRVAPPSRQVNHHRRLPYFDGLSALPARSAADEAWIEAEGIVSHQHPDHDTAAWSAAGHHEGQHG